MGFNGQGAARGAATGATAGAAFGPWGAAAGGVIGGLGGGLSNIFGGGGRQPGPYDTVNLGMGQDAAAMMQRGALLQRLQNRANGQGPSLAQMQGNQALTQGRQQLESMAVTDRRNPALARRSAMIQGGQLSARIQGQSMMGQLAEQQQAEAALAQAIAQAQQADNQRANIVQNAMNVRYTGQIGQPTEADRTNNVLASTLPLLGRFGKQGQG